MFEVKIAIRLLKLSKVLEEVEEPGTTSVSLSYIGLLHQYKLTCRRADDLWLGHRTNNEQKNNLGSLRQLDKYGISSLGG
jgi:hypothetical protein